jgi:hypothetical protein
VKEVAFRDDYSLKKRTGKPFMRPFGDVHQPLKENFGGIGRGCLRSEMEKIIK